MDGVENKVAVIVGGTSELGETISIDFADGDAKVAVCDINQEKVDSTVKKIMEKGKQAIGIAMNPAKSGEVKDAVDKIRSEFGKIDILVNNVDNSEGFEISEVSDDRWDKSVDENLNATFYFCREVLPEMRKNKEGRIVNVTSLEYLGYPGERVNYSATKSAIFGLTRSLALEAAKELVTVNCVAKGDIAGPDIPEDKAEKMASVLPVKRLGTPGEIARAVGFFASEKGKRITGQTLFVCGGKSTFCSMST